MHSHNLRNAPFVLLDDSRSPHLAKGSYLFHSPDYIIEAHSFEDIQTALEAIDEAVEKGFFVAGWIAYEAAASMENRLKSLINKKADEALIWMMVTKHREVLTAQEVGKLFSNAEQGNTRQFRNSFGQSPLSEQSYMEAQKRIHNYISAGDVYQINYTFPLPIEISGDTFSLYKQLRENQPVPYGALISTDTTTVLSLSPELFLEKTGTRLKSKPMKGTAARGLDAREDAHVSDFLKSDEKSKAENLMIVDLIRNDLSKISKPGSVKVPSLFDTEKYRTLFQMTSTVVAEEKDSLLPSDALTSMFPCGSVTGAPKIRAMEVINELEKSPRGIYCGTIGYFSKENWALNVPIRTIILNENQQGRLSVGSGVVADSCPKGEYQECLLKAQFTERNTPDFDLIESLLFKNGHYQNLDAHLSRLEESATYFGFPFSRKNITEQLEYHQSDLLSDTTYKIRLLYNKYGASTVTSDQVNIEASEKIETVILSEHIIDSNNLFYRHKTTNRTLYTQEYQSASQAGYADVLFFNEKGHLTEGAISNIIIQKNGTFYTPPVSDGLLPGIMRSVLCRTKDISITSITRERLLSADALYICNAIRGMRRVNLFTST